MVDDDQRLLEVFPDPPMVCFRRVRNVRETSAKPSCHQPESVDKRMDSEGARRLNVDSVLTPTCGKGRSLRV